MVSIGRTPPPTRTVRLGQPGRPTGWVGRLFGWVMARENDPMNALAVEALREIARVLRPGGRLVVALRVRSPEGGLRYDGIAYDEPAQAALRAQIEEAGLVLLPEVRRRLPKVLAAAVLARRSAGGVG